MTLMVLMVADEADLVRQTARRIARLRPGTAFEGFTDPLRALARLRESAPQVLVTDAQMPAMSGLELLSAARAVMSDLPVIVLAAAPPPELREIVEANWNAQLLEKPCSLEVLLAAIDRATSCHEVPSKGFSGRLRLPVLPDLIQILALSRVSVSVGVRSQTSTDGAASDLGRIWFQDGEIVHALHGDLSGPDAFFSLLTLEGGRFTTESCETPPERTISARWEELLMEGLRRIDETARNAAPEPQQPATEACFAPDELRLMRQAIRTGEKGLVVVAYRPSLEGLALMSGGGDVTPDVWKAAMIGMTGALKSLSCEPDGLFEDVREDAAIAISWSWPADRVVLLAQALESVSSVSHFRLRAGAFHRTLCASAQVAPPVGLEGEIGAGR